MRAIYHSVRQLAPAPAQQYFSLTPHQPPAPAPASLTVFFSHTIPAPAYKLQPAERGDSAK